MLVMPCLLRWTGQVRHAAVGSVDKTVMGAWCAGSYKVTPPGRSRAEVLLAGSTDRSEDSNSCVSRAASQTLRATPESSSLSCGTHAERPLLGGPNVVRIDVRGSWAAGEPRS